MRISPCSTNNHFKDPVLNRKGEAKAKRYTLRKRSLEKKSPAFNWGTQLNYALGSQLNRAKNDIIKKLKKMEAHNASKRYS